MFRLNVKITDQENAFLERKKDELQVSKAAYMRMLLDQCMRDDHKMSNQEMSLRL